MRQTLHALTRSRHVDHCKQLLLKLVALTQRYPWAVAAFGFCSGVASFILVDRQIVLANVVAILMLVSWLWLMLENLLRKQLQRWFGWQLPSGLLRYLTQMIHQESLFFILPFFFITTDWYSGQALFTGLLCACALIAIIDPLYYGKLAPRSGLYLSFHSLTLFALLLTAMPIILHLTTAQSYPLALTVAVALSLISLLSQLKARRWQQRLVLLGLTLLLGLGGWLGRGWVPPASLWLTDVAVSSERNGREAGAPLQQISQAQLQRAGLYAFTAINAPRGLNERIYHVWLQNGKERDRIALNIQGGREAGYRAWTRKQYFPAEAQGKWQVKVLTEAGQVLGSLHFQVTP